MSNAISGVGTKFYRDSVDSSGHQWGTPIAEILSISGPTMSRGTIDVTNLDSTGGYREFISGFRDSGQVTLKMNFTRDGYKAMKEDFDYDSPKDYKIVLPDDDATALVFSGFVLDLPMDIPADDKITCDITIKISGVTELSNDSSDL
jgi:predicted secreted protein